MTFSLGNPIFNHAHGVVFVIFESCCTDSFAVKSQCTICLDLVKVLFW